MPIFAFFVRGLFLFILIGFSFQIFYRNALKGPLILTILAVCSSLIFFAPFSTLAAKSGKFASIQWWFLIPIWPLLCVINKPKSFFLPFFVIAHLFKRIGLVTSILIILLTIPMISAGIWGLNYVSQHPSILVNPFALLIMGIIDLFFMRWVILALFYSFRDWQLWRKRFRIRQEIMTGRAFSEMISFHSRTRTLAALRRIRAQHRLVATAETEQFLKTLVFEIEVGQRMSKAISRAEAGYATKSVLPISMSDTEVIEGVSDCVKQLSPQTPWVLDEIYLLLQDIHLVRQSLL